MNSFPENIFLQQNGCGPKGVVRKKGLDRWSPPTVVAGAAPGKELLSYIHYLLLVYYGSIKLRTCWVLYPSLKPQSILYMDKIDTYYPCK